MLIKYLSNAYHYLRLSAITVELSACNWHLISHVINIGYLRVIVIFSIYKKKNYKQIK